MKANYFHVSYLNQNSKNFIMGDCLLKIENRATLEDIRRYLKGASRTPCEHPVIVSITELDKDMYEMLAGEPHQ